MMTNKALVDIIFKLSEMAVVSDNSFI